MNRITMSRNVCSLSLSRSVRAALAIGVFSLGHLLVASGALGQSTPAATSYKTDFQTQGTQASPTGWVDTSVGANKPAAEGLYKTWPDPTQGKQGTNIVYGTKQASGKPEG